MPPRIQCPSSRGLERYIQGSRIPSRCATSIWQSSSASTSRQYATASSLASVFKLPDDYVPPTKPPCARPPETRKSQLIRTYTSLLRSTPLILMFQHNNMTAIEWAAIRRELRQALAAISEQAVSINGQAGVDVASNIQMQVVRTGMFDVALKIVEFFDPAVAAAKLAKENGANKIYTHDLSKEAYAAMKAADDAMPANSTYAQLSPLMVGPLAILTFPAVSPQHLAAALSILAPSPPAFKAPTRKKNPGYWDATNQNALQKLLLVGARIEGKIFDATGVRWVGGIEGGIDGLRAQLVAMLQSAGMGLTSALEGTSKNLWLTMEGRKTMLEDEQKPPETAEAGEKKGESSP